MIIEFYNKKCKGIIDKFYPECSEKDRKKILKTSSYIFMILYGILKFYVLLRLSNLLYSSVGFEKTIIYITTLIFGFLVLRNQKTFI